MREAQRISLTVLFTRRTDLRFGIGYDLRLVGSDVAFDQKSSNVLSRDTATMFHRYVLLFVIASLTVSGRAAWASDVFVDINSKNVSSTVDLQAYPTGVSPLAANLSLSRPLTRPK